MNLRAYWRFLVVAYQFLPILVAYARDRRRFLVIGGSRQVDAATRRRRAESLLASMLTLGPTFIKLGQILSTRPDVLPPEYIDVFAQLQDSVPPAPWEEAREVLEEDLGPVEEAFDEFDTDAISGASLGQVYYAVRDGDPVAVKVRRPGVEALVEADLRVIKFSVPLLARFVDQAQAFSLETLADEFATVIRQEMDYRRERRMLLEIRENFTDNRNVRIPAVVDGASTGRVLTMEYVPGTKISNVRDLDSLGVDRTALAETLQRVYLKMIVQDGVFHADPHPGNLAVQDDGTLVFYDFGMSGRVDSFVQGKIVDFYAAVAQQNVDEILDTLIEMGTLSPEADRETMAEVMELAIADARGEDIEQYRVQQIVEQVEDTIYEFPLRLPPNLALVLRVATVVEGVCVMLDPDFDFIDVATDFLDEEGYIEAGIRDFLSEQADELRGAVQSSVRIPRKLERTLDRAERGDVRVEADLRDPNDLFERLGKRIVLGLFLAASTIAAAYLYVQASLVAAGAAVGALLVCLLLLYLSFREQRGIRAEPQFTRQNLRRRRMEGEGEAEDGEATNGLDGTGVTPRFGPDRADGANAPESAAGADGDRVDAGRSQGRDRDRNGDRSRERGRERRPSSPWTDGDRGVDIEVREADADVQGDGHRGDSDGNARGTAAVDESGAGEDERDRTHDTDADALAAGESDGASEDQGEDRDQDDEPQR